MNKIFCLLVTLSITYQCNCQENENLAVIYAVGRDVFVKESIGYTVKKLTAFAGDVTGIVAYKNYLLISEKRSGFLWSKEYSAIWRVKVSNTTSFGLNYTSWKKLHEISGVNEDILSMVVANEYIYAGRSDGIMWLCSVRRRGDCKSLNTFEGSITGIDYNPVDGHVYAIENDPLTYNVSNVLKRCSPDISNVCNQVILFDTNDGVTALKAAFGHIWLTTKKTVLWKCPFKVTSGKFATIYKNCQNFDQFDTSRRKYSNFENKYLYATDQYLYAYLKPDKYIWRCDPNESWSCSRVFQAFPESNDVGPFIVIKK